ncbi:MAG: hypothetical protein V4683_05530 [Bacteroidota bacterium]
MHKKKCINLFLLLAFVYKSVAQIPSIKDTVEYARSKAYQKNFIEADKLLTEYTNNNQNINALRLHAQVLYWMNEFSRSIEVFEYTIEAFPEISIVKLDFGRMLYELNKLPKAELVLNEYLLTDPQNPEANILLANINYWKGHLKKAREKLMIVLIPFPNNPMALAILNEINLVCTPTLKLNGDFASDSQPLERAGIQAEAGWYQSWLFSPTFQVNGNRFNSTDGNNNSLWMQLGNKIFLGYSGFSLGFKAGLFNHPAESKSLITTAISVNQKITKSIFINIGTEKIPYQYTTSSVSIPVMQQLSSLAIHLNKNDRWLAKAAYELQQFEDNNQIQTAYAWALAPILHKKYVKLKGGFVFSYANSVNNTFISINPINQIIGTNTPGDLIKGYYKPYFTPNNQIINSLLVSFEIQLSKRILITSNNNIGVFANADNPQLLFSKNQGNSYSIIKSYYKQSYSPMNFQTEIKIKLSDRLALSGLYEYNRLLFYTLSKSSVGLKYALINEKKK